jgi:amino acid transporter
MGGVMKSVSGVFFAYIGFDAISTTAEECENPQRDLPKGMIYSLIICTVLYILIALVLTGMVNYKELQVADPLAFVFQKIGLHKISYIISVSAVIATASVLLIFQLGQPRIWMAMSRDGLLPKAFSKIHPKYKTPSFSTIITGIAVAVPALFLNLTEVTDLTSIGTLFAFVLVCGGVLLLEEDKNAPEGRFKIPYINSKYLVPGLLIGAVAIWHKPLVETFKYDGWESFREKIALILFLIIAMIFAVLSFLKNLSFIPVAGLLSCFYLMTELEYSNWIRFLAWLLAGLVVYFTYSYRNSKLNKIA